MSKSADSQRPSQPASRGRQDPDAAALESSEVFSLLANRRRLEAIKVLSGVDGAIEFGELAETLACVEQETTREALSSDDRQAVYVSLYQTHVPKLRDAGVVEYDDDAGLVAPTDDLSQLTQYLDVDGDESSRWQWLDYHVLGGTLSVALWMLHFLSVLGGYGVLIHVLSVTSTTGVTVAHLVSSVRSELPFAAERA